MFSHDVLSPIERGPDGELPSLTAQQKRAVRRLVKRCSNNDGGNCLPLDCICPQSVATHLICRFFRRAVLPEDPGLEADILKARPMRRCRICGKRIPARSNRAKYCRGCAAQVHRKQKTASERKRRSAVDK